MSVKPAAYIFPLTTNKKPFNNYVVFLANALSADFDIVNSKNTKNLGVIDFFKYNRANAFILNWPENIYKLKYGRLQFALFSVALLLLKLSGKKIFWILHNKYPHTGEDSLSKLSMRLNSWAATTVITHSKSGIEFYKDQFHRNNIVYIPHPNYPDATFSEKEEIYDIIIWGKIAPYKNIVGFLEFVVSSPELKKLKILICGECDDQSYAQKINQLATKNIIFVNRYLTAAEINDYISSSKIILFTYNSQSLLSSGALVYSLPSGKIIIGPDLGSFKDYEELGLIATYKTFEDIPQIIKKATHHKQNLEKYLEENTWDKFPEKFSALLIN